MANAPNDRQLLARLNSRTEKSRSWMPKHLAIDLVLREQPAELIDEPREALRLARENLRACQAVIQLAGGFDPTYVDHAQAAMKIDDAMAKASL